MAPASECHTGAAALRLNVVSPQEAMSSKRYQTAVGASAGRLSMKELTEKTALPAPGGP